MRKKTNSRTDDDEFPWAWLMYRALEAGISYDAFWQMSPRAVLSVLHERLRARADAGAISAMPTREPDTVRLGYIPRP